jgi:three-Cys-motif partner protein
MAEHQFGGSWTERKLEALHAYLNAYQVIFTRNPQARKLKTIYVDAFAGTGERDVGDDGSQQSLFGYDSETRGYQEGSVKIALSLPNKFHRYVFLDSKAGHVQALRDLVRRDFPALEDRCRIERAEANAWLQRWCREQDWRAWRAVAFLDPYGMNVEWATLEAIAQTKAIDLWVLFPLGIGASRVLPTDMPPEGAWADRLTKLFGTDDWRKRFYRRKARTTLFEDAEDAWIKIAGIREILELFLGRLNSVFEQVVERPLILTNSRNSPMYALCFASANPRGAKTAVKIAGYLTRE